MCRSSASAEARARCSSMRSRCRTLAGVMATTGATGAIGAMGAIGAIGAAALLLVAPVYAQQPPSGDGSTPLHWAAYQDDLAKVDQLIRAGANVNAAND